MTKVREHVNKATGEVREIKESDLNKLIVHEHKRSNGSLRVQLDFSNCVSLTEQHSAQETDVNYLVQKYSVDELANYLALKPRAALPDLNDGYDASVELNPQNARNAVYAAKQAFNELPEEVRNQFRHPVEFFKFIDNPLNQEKMIRLGLIKKKDVQALAATQEPAKPDPLPSPSSSSSNPS